MKLPGVPPSPVPSPCIQVCIMDEATGWCEGCWRTLDEIAGWGSASEAIKIKVWEKIILRQYSGE